MAKISHHPIKWRGSKRSQGTMKLEVFIIVTYSYGFPFVKQVSTFILYSSNVKFYAYSKV